LYRRAPTREAITALKHHSWPGNIRELKNLIQRLLILRQDEQIEADEVRVALGQAPAQTTLALPAALFDGPLREARDGFERLYLEYNLEHTEGNVTAMAEIAGMERTHLYRKMKSLGINPKEIKKR